MPSFSIRAFGCQMNQYDARRTSAHLESCGWTPSGDDEEADAIILFTCNVRAKAADKLFSHLGRLRETFGDGPVVAVVGCVAAAEGENIFRRAPNVSIVLSSRQYHKLPELLDAALHTRAPALDIGTCGLEKFSALPAASRAAPVEFLQIQEGCDQYCSYCCVPYTRGREESRPAKDVLAEAENLAARGAVELNLLGQNVNAYNGGMTLAALVREVAKLPQILRLRYTTSYPSLMTDEMAALHGAEPKLAPLLYLPMQSGSDRVLKNMNRKYTRAQYMDIVGKFRRANPQMRISSDFIVGFPGETDADFEETLGAVREIGFIQSFSFKFSPREGTPAAGMDGQVPDEVKTERIMRLQSLLRAGQDAFNRSCSRRRQEVLWTEISPSGELVGRNGYQQLCIARPGGKAAELLGRMTSFTPESASYANLRGRVK